MKIQDDLNNFKKLIGIWYSEIKFDKNIDLFDSSKLSENISVHILSQLYSLENLVLLSDIKGNFPSIDIGDKSKRLCFQITSNENYDSKIINTLEKFISNNLDNDYDIIKILFLTYDEIPYRKKYSDIYSNFSSSDILNFDDIIHLSYTLYCAESEKIKYNSILKILDKQFPYINVLKEEKINTPTAYKDNSYKPFSDDKTIVFFIDTLKRKPLACFSYILNNQKFIVGIYEKQGYYNGNHHYICILKNFANTWQIEFNDPITEDELYLDGLCNSELLFNNTPYLYIERVVNFQGTMFNGTGQVEFILFDLHNHSLHKLTYLGTYRNGLIEGTFDTTLINTETDYIKSILETKATQSNKIFRTPDNFDINSHEHYIQKWKVENSDFFAKRYGIINFYYYKENLFWDYENYLNLLDYKKENEHIENDSFLIFNYFAGPVLALNKITNTYFVIIIPNGWPAGGSWGIRSYKQASFIENNKIKIENDLENYEIDLDTGHFETKHEINHYS